MKKTSSHACGFTKHVVEKWISDQWISSNRCEDTPSDSAQNSTRRTNRALLLEQLGKDREFWWGNRAADMERAAAAGNTHKLFQLIRSIRGKKNSVSETICESDGRPIHDQEHRLARWSEHFKLQFKWPPPTITRQCSPGSPWSVDSSAPSANELIRELKNLKRHKAPGPDDLPPDLFKGRGIHPSLRTAFTTATNLVRRTCTNRLGCSHNRPCLQER